MPEGLLQIEAGGEDLVAILELSPADERTELLQSLCQAATLTAADRSFLLPPRPCGILRTFTR